MSAARETKSAVPEISDEEIRKKYSTDAEQLIKLKNTLKSKGYVFKKRLGRGAYGLVALFAKDNINVAVKVINGIFNELIDAKRCVREIYLLRMLNHPSINSIVDIIQPEHPDNFDQLIVVLKAKATNLFNVIYSEQLLSIDHSQYFSYQILSALKYLNEANVMHRDLKLANVFVDIDCDLQVGDFGLGLLSKTPDTLEDEVKKIPLLVPDSKVNDQTRPLTPYVVTRWHRAPEIILAHICLGYKEPDYKSSADIWSVGLMLLEMLFSFAKMPTTCIEGNSSREQLKKIFALVGCSKKDLESMNPAVLKYVSVNSEYLGFGASTKLKDQPRALTGMLAELQTRIAEIDKQRIKTNEENKRKGSGAKSIPLIDEEGMISHGIDLVERMLQLDPKNRISAEDAVKHPFLVGLNKEDKITPFHAQLRDEAGNLTIQGLSAVRLRQLETYTNVTKKILCAYINDMIKSFPPKAVLAEVPDGVRAAPIASSLQVPAPARAIALKPTFVASLKPLTSTVGEVQKEKKVRAEVKGTTTLLLGNSKIAKDTAKIVAASPKAQPKPQQSVASNGKSLLRYSGRSVLVPKKITIVPLNRTKEESPTAALLSGVIPSI